VRRPPGAFIFPANVVFVTADVAPMLHALLSVEYERMTANGGLAEDHPFHSFYADLCTVTGRAVERPVREISTAEAATVLGLSAPRRMLDFAGTVRNRKVGNVRLWDEADVLEEADARAAARHVCDGADNGGQRRATADSEGVCSAHLAMLPTPKDPTR